MKWDTLQVMMYGQHLHPTDIRIDQPGLEILDWHEVGQGRYLFVDLKISANLKAGDYTINVEQNNDVLNVNFPLQARMDSIGRYKGFGPQDIIYLITPDRFVNGDPENDVLPEMRDIRDKSDILGRHGGDIAGIIDKLPYLHDLGVTALWINPLLENDMDISYHGYAATDLYNIDPRFGSYELYRRLVEQAHKNGLKVILDHVSNHIGIYHQWMASIPTADWLNGQPGQFKISRHDKQVLFDINSDTTQLKYLRRGWFVDSMPDLNQNNPYVSNYLIQNTLWWIESTGLDGIREDTFPYVAPEFLQKWRSAIKREYPKFTIVGEIWVHDPVFIAPFQIGNRLQVANPAQVQSLTDFGLFEAFGQIFYKNMGLYPLYQFISRDFLYGNPNQLMTFLDNHDVMRFMDVVKNDTLRYEMGLFLLMTIRGIPQIYYGTEIGLSGGGLDHGQIRANFPGGFPGDPMNKFKKAGRTSGENRIYNLLKNLIRIRRKYVEFRMGATIHYPPKDNVYIFFRHYQDQKSLVIVNGSSKNRRVDITDQINQLEGYTTFLNLLNGDKIPISQQTPEIPASHVRIFKVLP